MISLNQAFAQWQELAASIPATDEPARAESWNNYTDALCKDGELCALQYHHAPAWDEPMPGEGLRYDALADDRAFILDRMGVTLSAVFVPFSQSRSKGETSPSLNWRVTLQYRGRDVIETDYMQGCAHAPAYSAPNLGIRTSILRDEKVRAECETGKTGLYSDSVGALLNAKPIPAPDVADVLYSALQDASALDSGGFSEWCADMGMDDDNIRARATYDACVDTAVKLRAAFGDKTLRDLYELFEGM